MATSSQPTHPLPTRRVDMMKTSPEYCDEENFGIILRTRSLDEADTPRKIRQNSQHNELSGHFDDENTKNALHSSFDSALFAAGTSSSNCGSSFPSRQSLTEHNVWDEEGDVSIGDISGKKHLLPSACSDTIESRPPSTVRKLARRMRVEGSSNNNKAPGRPPAGFLKKPCSATPCSAVKRRRAPLPHRLSPMRKVPPTTPNHSSTEAATTRRRQHDHGLSESPLAGTSCLASPLASTPTRAAFGSTTKPTPKWQNTCTTGTSATTLLETTFESDSVETSSPTTTRFRFTSFPASLPRVNNPRSRDCPLSVRKRMSFGDPLALDESKDDDGTQNTSISSLSADGHHAHLPLPPGKQIPGSFLCNNLNMNDETDEPFHGQLFSDEENLGYSEDDTIKSPARDVVGRTRLDFNVVLSPKRNEKMPIGNNLSVPAPMDLTRPYDQKRINSFQSSLSSNTNTNIDEGTYTFTPSRPPTNKERPHTPREVQLHFPPEAECSPIPGVREDPVDCSFGCAKGPEISPHLLSDELILANKHHQQQEEVVKVRPPGRHPKAKEESSTTSEGTNEKTRGLRPIPDMSGFDRSSDDSVTLDSSKGMPSSHRFHCPPTPVRTPAWANENSAHAFFGRQNSLITTKVLLSCPSQVLVGRCSLESSVLVLDDDSKWKNIDNTSTSNEKKSPGERSLNHPEKDDFVDAVATSTTPQDPILAPPKLTRRIPSPQKAGSVITFSSDFDVLGILGSGAFADVYKVRSLRDNRLYAVKRNRRQFRGKRDRDIAMSEVRCMQQLQSTCITEPEANSDDGSGQKNRYSLYLLFFYNAWQEDGYFYCQTELCCRDTCRELLDSLRFLWNSCKKKYPSLLRHLSPLEGIQAGGDADLSGRSVPVSTVWKILHDILAGLSHIHSHGVVHNDIKPSNIFFVEHTRFGAMCKIGDFGMACKIGSSGDGQEGDARYLAPESLKSGIKSASADIFSLGLTMFEIASDQQIEIASEGPRWHELRSMGGVQLPNLNDNDLVQLIKKMTDPEASHRQTADAILKNPKIEKCGQMCDEFLRDYLRDIEEFDRVENERQSQELHEQTPRNGSNRSNVAVRSPSLSMMFPAPLLSPMAARPF